VSEKLDTAQRQAKTLRGTKGQVLKSLRAKRPCFVGAGKQFFSGKFFCFGKKARKGPGYKV
jgi:hypothetical protein